MSTRVSFVGAGPGDPELITVKGLCRLRAADVILHDCSVSTALLGEARPGAEILGAGLSHAELLDRMLERARRGARVVRLNDGDPTLFGRLGEEILALRAAALDFEIVSGVTAATAAAALAEVSLTDGHRMATVVLATGTDDDGRRPAGLDWDGLARADGTLVFYMAVQGLSAITAALMGLGRDPRESAVIIERAGREGQRVLAGRLCDVVTLARDARVGSPAVLLVGPTVSVPAVPARARATLVDAGARPGVRAV
jgi:uroporphyrin-III C-methyltransferase